MVGESNDPDSAQPQCGVVFLCWESEDELMHERFLPKDLRAKFVVAFGFQESARKLLSGPNTTAALNKLAAALSAADCSVF